MSPDLKGDETGDLANEVCFQMLLVLRNNSLAIEKLQTALTSFNRTLSNSIKNYISVIGFLLDGLVQVFLRKAVITDPFIECFKAVLYERSWSLPLLKWSTFKQLLFLILLSTSPTTNNKQC